MSFSAEFESLITEVEFRWQQLDSLLSIGGSAQLRGNRSGLYLEDAALRAQMHEFLASLQQIQSSYSQHQQRASELARELTRDLENVRRCAIDYFAKGHYWESAGLLSFLGRIECHENMERLLDVVRRSSLERQDVGSNSLEPNPLPGSKDLIQKSDDQSRESPIHGLPGSTSSHDLGPPAHQARASEALCAAKRSSTQSCLATTEPIVDEGNAPKAIIAVRPGFDVAPKRTFTVVEDGELWARLDPLIQGSSGDPRLRVWRSCVLPIATAVAMLWLLAKAPLQLSEHPQEIPAAETRLTSDPTSTLPRVTVEDLRLQAQELYEAGKLRDAEEICRRILTNQEDDIFALALEDRIRKSLSDKNPEIARPVSETFQEHPFLDSAPGDILRGRASHRKHTTSVPLASQLAKPVSDFRKTSLPKRIPQILGAHVPAARNIFSVKPQPAKQPEELAKPAAASDGDNEALRKLNSSIQAHEPELRVNEGKQLSLVMSLLQKAESALIVGHYVTPDNENVLAYCNQALKLDARNRRALEMKKDVVARAVAQAKEWIQRGRFDSARAYFASMDHLALNDSEFPYPKAEFKQELQKLEFKSYPVVHDHRLGSCSGQLRINAYVISYVPSDDSGDGFTERLRSVVVAEDRDRLSISCGGMNLRFHIEGLSGGPDDTAARRFYRQFIAMKVDEKSTLTVSYSKPPLKNLRN